MKMAATPSASYWHSASFVLPSLLQLYSLFHEYQCLDISVISEGQTEKMNINDTEISWFMQNTEATLLA